MRKLIASYQDYEVVKVNDGYIVKNTALEYSNHAHFDKCSGALKCLELIKKKKYPRSNYFQVSMQRIMTDNELEHLVYPRRKEKYVNVRR